MANAKKLAEMIVLGEDKPGEEHLGPEAPDVSSANDGEIAAAEELQKALKDGDGAAVASALKTFFETAYPELGKDDAKDEPAAEGKKTGAYDDGELG